MRILADSILEHVLRLSSNGSDPTGFRTRNRSLSIITNPYEGFEVPPSDESVPFKARPNGRSVRQLKYSPTPSIKRGKAEQLLKEHGSPPGIRVTAGGRIVPDGLTPITSPRFDQRRSYAPRPAAQINIPPVDIHNLPSPGYLQTVQGYLVVADGQIYQVHNGGLIGVGQVGNPTLDLVCPPSNHILAPGTNFDSGVDWLVPGHQMTYAGFPPVPEHAHINEHTMRKLEECHTKFQEELRELDRNEVLQRDSLTAGGKREIVRQRVALVNRIDDTRRSILTARKVLNDRALNLPADQSRVATLHSSDRIASPPGPPQHPMSVPTSFNYGIMPGLELPAPDVAQYPMTAPLFPQTFGYGAGDAMSTLHVGSEFVPYLSRPAFSTRMQMQNRDGNDGLGISNGFGTADGENNGLEMRNVPTAPKSMNFDGSGHQPKRSHAVPIKAPEQNALERKATLNPASPSYQPFPAGNPGGPSDAIDKHPVPDEANFTPSLKQVADVDQLVQSPARQHSNVHQGPTSSRHRVSSSTAGTEDFFPQDAQEHSTTRYSYDAREQAADLHGWMSQENNPNALTTPQRPLNMSNKFIWNDSPEERFFDALPDHDECPRTAFTTKGVGGPFSDDRTIPSPHDGAHGDVSMLLSPSPTKLQRVRLEYRSHSPEATVINAESPMERTPGGQTPVGYLMRRSGNNAPLPVSPVKDLYRLGHDDGLSNKLDGIHCELEYLQGLREGLQERTRQMCGGSPSSGLSLAAVQHRVASALQFRGHDRTSEPAQLPKSRRESMAPSGAPGAPVNTPIGTPTAMTPKTGLSLDDKFSPATALAFSSQPNVKVADIYRGMGTQTSASRLSKPEPGSSPLVKRASGGSFRESAFGSPGESFTARMQRLELQDKQPRPQQRYDDGDLLQAHTSRSKASVVQSLEQARAVFHQHDGLDEDSERNTVQRPNIKPPGSHDRAGRSPLRTVGQPNASRSPSKRLVSAAATVLAYGRKLTSPEPQARSPVSPGSNKNSSPTKTRMGWRRRADEREMPASSMTLSPK